MSKFLGDVSRLTVHDAKRATELCAVGSIDAKYKVDIYSTELLEFLIRTENWHSCEHCLVSGVYHGEHAPAVAPEHA